MRQGLATGQACAWRGGSAVPRTRPPRSRADVPPLVRRCVGAREHHWGAQPQVALRRRRGSGRRRVKARRKAGQAGVLSSSGGQGKADVPCQSGSRSTCTWRGQTWHTAGTSRGAQLESAAAAACGGQPGISNSILPPGGTHWCLHSCFSRTCEQKRAPRGGRQSTRRSGGVGGAVRRRPAPSPGVHTNLSLCPRGVGGLSTVLGPRRGARGAVGLNPLGSSAAASGPGVPLALSR